VLQICASFASSRTDQTLCVALLEQGVRPFFVRADVSVAPLEMP
jgi:hypothetical protein